MSLPLLKNSLTLLFLIAGITSYAQIGNITLVQEKDKPEKFKTKTLRSEKTGEKKFTLPRRIVQNTTTHYNYYFNANNKLNEVLEKARMGNKEDYTKLLPFYGYSLEGTSAQATELDSVIYKATAGILLHDLRSDWVDNMYLLIGKAYLLRKDFDSAAMTFQFINYNLVPKKKKDEDQTVVGTNANAADQTVSIANKEKRNIFQKTFTKPPSRNDALVWQARVMIEQGEYPDAAALINTLHNDPNLPKRLRPDLEEVNSYWFYKQDLYDSAAIHLEKALANAEDKQDRARWEFLLAQMYERTKNTRKANDFYAKAINHTVDPLLDIYARLNRAKMLKSGDPKELDNAIDNLVKMAKRDKFDTYRDILYYSAGELALEKPDTTRAIEYFKQSIAKNESNTTFKNKAFLQLADIAFERKDFKMAHAYYDSLQSPDSTLGDLVKIQQRKDALTGIIEKVDIIEREDSLQRIAAMSLADREAFLKKLLKRLRKEQGLKDDEPGSTVTGSSVFDNVKNAPVDIFQSSDKGDFYFYNASMKAKGFNEFQTKWGKRVNVDNWRTKSATDVSAGGVTPGLPMDTKLPSSPTGKDTANTDLSMEGLTANLPLTPEQLNKSNTTLSISLFDLGKLYQNNLEEYGLAIETYEQSLQRFPDSLYDGEIYMNLSYCYQKTGDLSRAAFYKNLLSTKFKDSKFGKNVTAVKTDDPEVAKNTEATKRYEGIYNLFIEGKFDEAVAQKRAADSLYGENYWNPQLLYIEAVYHVRQRNDSIAALSLNKIINDYPNSSLKSKAQNLLEVIGRRNEIETYLNNLNIQRASEDSVKTVVNNTTKPNSNITNPVTKPVTTNPVVADSSKTSSPVTGPFVIDPSQPHHVVMILDKVDPVFVSEARNALNRYTQSRLPGIEMKKDAIDKERAILQFSGFKTAQEALDNAIRIKRDAASELSWLPANKYYFVIISETNLQLLKANKDVAAYRSMMNTIWPGKL